MTTAPPAAPVNKAAEICKRFPLSEPAAKLLRDEMKPQAFLDVLVEKQHFADATRLLAHSMPTREAIWWSCLCVRPEPGGAAAPPVAAAQLAAEAWVAAPTDAKRRAAHVAGEVAGVPPPVKLMCAAVFFSEGSLGPAEFQAVPPPEHMAATHAANAVILTAVAKADKMTAKYRQFLALGQEVAAGKQRWK